MLKLRVTFNPFVQKAEPPPVAKKDEPETLCGCFLLVGEEQLEVEDGPNPRGFLWRKKVLQGDWVPSRFLGCRPEIGYFHSPFFLHLNHQRILLANNKWQISIHSHTRNLQPSSSVMNCVSSPKIKERRKTRSDFLCSSGRLITGLIIDFFFWGSLMLINDCKSLCNNLLIKYRTEGINCNEEWNFFLEEKETEVVHINYWIYLLRGWRKKKNL